MKVGAVLEMFQFRVYKLPIKDSFRHLPLYCMGKERAGKIELLLIRGE